MYNKTKYILTHNLCGNVKFTMVTKNENFDAFKTRLISKMSYDDIQRVMFAYQISKEAHRRQFRDGGKMRYFEHARA